MVTSVIRSDCQTQIPVGRLAPSPTGVLHLGNARSFLLAWLLARSAGGSLLMRVEDIDGPRIREGAAQQALDDIRWLGLDWDSEVVYQSTRLAEYAAIVDHFLSTGLAYPCVCTRREVEEAASAPHESWHDAVVYPGTCRGLFTTRQEAREVSGRDPAVRFRVEVDEVAFLDGFLGRQRGQIAGDFVVQKRDGGPAYQLGVVVDDVASGVTQVLRGDDLLVSTPRQLLLYEALGSSPPQFTHVPLVVGSDGKRLAKRHGDTSLRRFREDGVSPEQVVGYLAWISGLQDTAEPCTAQSLLDGFSLQKIPAQPAVVREPWCGTD